MNRLIYEKSVSHQGHLIIPFVFAVIDSKSIYSYKLLSELGHKGKFHKTENPSGICSNKLDTIIDIAKEFLDENSDIATSMDIFSHRYTYCHNLIIVYEESGKYFYDHYKQDNLNNIAAPKIFASEQDCLDWVKQGLDHSSTSAKAKNA